MNKKAVVTGAAGFIGNHLCHYLKNLGYWVYGVDMRPPKYHLNVDVFENFDLRDMEQASWAMRHGPDEVYHLAAEMGGMGFISDPQNQIYIMRSNALCNFNVIEAAATEGTVKRFFFSSSACVYPTHLQETLGTQMLKEADAWPAQPQKSYGLEKIVMEEMCRYYQDSGHLETRVARFENCMGENGAWHGGREKAPAALSRKVAIAKLSGNPEVEIWGDGQAERTFIHAQDLVRGIHLLVQSDHHLPTNLGSDELISIDNLALTIADIAGVDIAIRHVDGPQGVRSRNADTSKAREILGWMPELTLQEGLSRVYCWVERQVEKEWPTSI